MSHIGCEFQSKSSGGKKIGHPLWATTVNKVWGIHVVVRSILYYNCDSTPETSVRKSISPPETQFPVQAKAVHKSFGRSAKIGKDWWFMGCHNPIHLEASHRLQFRFSLAWKVSRGHFRHSLGHDQQVDYMSIIEVVKWLKHTTSFDQFPVQVAELDPCQLMSA